MHKAIALAIGALAALYVKDKAAAHFSCADHDYRVYGEKCHHDGDRDGVGCEHNPPPRSAKQLIEDGGCDLVLKVGKREVLWYGTDKFGRASPGSTDFAFAEKDMRFAFNLYEGKIYWYNMKGGKLALYKDFVGALLSEGSIFIVNYTDHWWQ